MARRTLLKGTAAVATAGFGGTAAADGDAFDALRLRWRELLLGSGFDPAAEPYAGRLAALGTSAAAFRDGLVPAPGRVGQLWFDLPLGSSSANVTTSYARLHTMAQAWAQPGTGLTADPGLARAVVDGLERMHRQAYHERTRPYGNWWDWQIGSARRHLDTVLLLHDRLTAAQLGRYLAACDHFVPDAAVASYTGTSTGANRADLCRVLAVRGVLGRDAEKIALARDALSPVFRPVSTGDGLYEDGSFIQHTDVPYTGSYGEVLLDGLARLLALLAGSRWQITDSHRRQILDSVEHAFAPFLHNGLMMDAVSGRAISRQGADDHTRGHAVLARIALLARAAGPVQRARWTGLLKGWIERERYRPVLVDYSLTVADLARLHAVARSPIEPLPEPSGHRLFAAMDRAVHRAPGWTAGLSMCSRRTAYYETGNGENLRGWHTGAGMLQWWGASGTDGQYGEAQYSEAQYGEAQYSDGQYGEAQHPDGQYSDGFWPTVDPYRLPGVTVSRKRLADGEGGEWGASRPDVAFVGGATDGRFAVVGQEIRGLASTLTAHRSWFFLDDAVVCLGAGITAHDGTGVETVVDNRNLGAGGLHTLTVDGLRQPGGQGWSAVFPGARWAHLAGHGGYLFPGGATLSALREERTGSWREVATTGSRAPVVRRYLTLWLDHGVDPAGARCAFVLMPGASARAVALRAAGRGWLRVLANSGSRQGITVPALGLTAVNFFAAGSVGPLSVSGPASVLVRDAPGRTTVKVADPTRGGRPLDLRLRHARWRISPGTSGMTVTNSTTTTR